ncbi:hypothetical protein N7535_007000 [Penicillium sp. DV-2018c]|nr:hypothetical protein N7535_007000 [Penicillium sp. DV-2018c]
MDADDYTIVPLPFLTGRLSVIFNAPLSFEKLQESWQQTLQARPIMQARVRRSTTAASGLEYHALTPRGMAKYLEAQSKAPDHLKDFFCLDESHRSVSDYWPGVKTGANSSSQSQEIFIADNANSKDQQRCTSFNAVQNIDELINSDRPAVTLQVTRFSDATLVTISFSHIIGDIFTIKTILKGWESSLHHQPVLPFERLGEDPFSAYGPGGKLAGEDATSKSPLMPPGWRIYGILDKIRFVARFLWDCYITRPEKTMSQKYIFIPEAEIVAMEEQAKEDVRKIEAQRKELDIKIERPLFVSRSNIIHAWLLKQKHTYLNPNKWSSPVTIVNARAKPPTGMKARSDDFPSHDWYSGATAVAIPSLQVRDILAMPLGQLALHIREGIMEGASPENGRRWLSFNLHNNLWKKPSGKVALWCPPDHYLSGLSDWRLIPLHELDFTPARFDHGDERVQVCGFNAHMAFAGTQRNRWVCLGEAGGGVWLLGNASETEWREPSGFGKYTHVELR